MRRSTSRGSPPAAPFATLASAVLPPSSAFTHLEHPQRHTDHDLAGIKNDVGSIAHVYQDPGGVIVIFHLQGVWGVGGVVVGGG